MENFTNRDIDGKAPMFYLIVLIFKNSPSLTMVHVNFPLITFNMYKLDHLKINVCSNLSPRHLNLKGCKETTNHNFS
jgi:hypothetical protein